MNNSVVGRPLARRFRFQKLVMVCAAAGALPGALFAGSSGIGNQSGEASGPVSVDMASVGATQNVADSVGTGEFGGSATTGSVRTKKRTAFDMSQVERIRVRVWGDVNLGGEYSLDPDNSLSFPRLGRIEIGTMTPADLEQVISQKLSALTRNDVNVAIEVARFKPYFIMGQVAEAGAVEWRPGLKVIQAISLARGVLRSNDRASSGRVAGVSLQQSQTQLTFALAQLARLKAEREGVDYVQTSDRISTLIKSVPENSQVALKTLIARQNDMLSEQREMMQTQLVGLRREREAAQSELTAAETQEKAVLSQLEITRDQLADIESLKNKQLVSKSRYLSQKSELLSSEVRYAETHTMVERARARLNGVDQQMVSVPQQRRAALNERIDDIERQVAQLEYATGTQDGGSAANDVLKLSYHIARDGGSGVETIAASVFTEVMPGDVVIVSDAQDGGQLLATEQPTSNKTEASKSSDEAQRVIEASAVDSVPTALRRAVSQQSSNNPY